MILQNNKGKEKEFEILFEIKKNTNDYIVYKDIMTDKVYGGKINGDKLKALNDKEYKFLNKIVEKLDS